CARWHRYGTPVGLGCLDPAFRPSGGGPPVSRHGHGFTPHLFVTIGGRELIGLAIVDPRTATGMTPPGAAGGADVLALSHDGKGELRRGFVYQDALRVDSVSPAVIGTVGGDKLVVAGAGFGPRSAVKIDGAGAPSAWIDDQH